MEYYLQQSQLSHYSERKIKEFQDHIEELQKEYQHYLWKLRRLDPSHKEHPWKPRAYTRKRPSNSAMPTISQLATLQSLKRLCVPQSNKTEGETYEHDSDAESGEVRERSCPNPRIPDGVIYDCSIVNPNFQDQPLTFNPARVPPRFSMHLIPKNSSEDPHLMTKILMSHLPNLEASSSCQTTAELNKKEKEIHALKIREDSQESVLQTKSSGILGLSCYSSDEDT
ncbi:uncharacterized protein si:dkey-86e18.1 isoform X2 [Heterodontus francisci]